MIHSSAIIDSSAIIADNVEIGPWAIIGPKVEIGEGTVIGSNVVINGPTKIGKNNKIYQFASIGEDTQDKKYNGEEEARLEIGDGNTFREYCTVHRGTENGGYLTKIGNNNLFMVYTHVAHDCIVGNNVVFSNNASIAGHVVVGDYATLGGLSGVHQFCSIGCYSFIAGGSIIFKDVLPFIKVAGNPAQAYGLNSVGLSRNEFGEKAISMLSKAYKLIFRKNLTIQNAIDEIKKLAPTEESLQIIVDFVNTSTRGLTR